MGVEIQTSLTPAAVHLSAEKEVQTVTCWGYDGQTMTHIDCKQVLLACGPWTPSIYETLFPTSRLRLQWITDAGDWILCKNPCPSTKNTTAVVSFAHLVGEKLEFAALNDGTIWGCGRRNHYAPLPPPGHAEEPDEALVAELSAHAQRWLDWSCHCTEEHAGMVQVVKKSNTGSDTVKRSSGFFVCWGHGLFGLTLGMGNGRLTSQLMSGEEPDIDLTPFSLYED
ncbi:hypothetical protein INS49_012427 [Diaporthe citri]|uniref:uncharacterized protein n=1 Tax=Diaporthe citri TaxID=83186 RepID=UPI001C7FE02D|nr:uncharacterized protein INS49_012427 [Diaporthe citri]KAG6358907.1 hypothetical protein INS49_012427 [Diaporthe citri]